MSIPSSYSYSDFKDYLTYEVLQETAKSLNWIDDYDGSGFDSTSIYRAITDEALIILGYSDISEVTGLWNVKRLRMMARIEAWRAVAAATFGDVHLESEGTQYNRQQIFNNAIEQLQFAEQDFVNELVNEVDVLSLVTTHSNIKPVWR